jgi:phenylpropionate dioxygenase-like ring-hydroxylating dioxygenase large terminal subunit
MSALSETSTFNATDRLVEGWYWALPASELPAGKVRKLRMLGRDLVAWRGKDGVAHLMDAYCPHMGAHLGEGAVDGNSLRCFFHNWRFDGEGQLAEIPCQDHVPRTGVRAWPTAEQYGMIWLWTGDNPRHPVPYVPELAGKELRSSISSFFTKACHPNVVMINAIDEQHFDSVHNLVVDLHFDIEELHENAATYDNHTRLPDTSWFTRALGRFYAGPLTYRMTYWNGTTGSVTVGPDLWHFHIMFALRPTDEGSTEGATLLLTPKVEGPVGWAWNKVALRLTKLVGDYFAKGDTEVFQSIRWRFDHPIKADRSIIHFIQHVERQTVVSWGDWEVIPDRARQGLQCVT